MKWLGFDWEHGRDTNLYYASDYFDFMYDAAEYLIEEGHAYVDSLSAEQMRALRGTLTEPGKEQPLPRPQPRGEPEALPRRCATASSAEGEHVLRAKIDMASPNINLRDPAIYRIRKATHHRTGDKWCIYPMYTYAHPIEDALENITHSLCTLEFEDQRPFYDWLLERLAEGELARAAAAAADRVRAAQPDLRRALQAAADPARRGGPRRRLGRSAHADARRRAPPRLHAGRLPPLRRAHRRLQGRLRWIDYSILEDCMREHLNEVAPRRMAVLDPVKLVIENYPEGQEELCEVPNHPQKPDWGKRKVPFSRELWIEREDFTETPPKGYFRLFPGNKVRLRYGFVIECTGYDSSDATPCAAPTIPTRNQARPAPRRSRSRATSTGSARSTRTRRRCGSTTGCSRSAPGRGRTRDFLAGSQSGLEESHHRPARAGAQGRASPRSASSSSATAISSRTAAIRSPARRDSIAR